MNDRKLLNAIIVCLTLALPVAAAGATSVIDGRLLDASGTPLTARSGATVTLEPLRTPAERLGAWLPDGSEDARSEVPGPPPPLARATPDDDGLWTLRVAEPGVYSLFAEAPGSLRVTTTIAVVRDKTLPDVYLPPAPEISLRVVDPDGRPVAGALLASGWSLSSHRLAASGSGRPASGLSSAWHLLPRPARTDAEGLVRLSAVDGEPIHVTAPGFSTRTADPAKLGLERGGPERGGTRSLRLARGDVQTLLAVDARDRPVAGAVLYATGGGDAHGFRPLLPLGRTDDDGRLELVRPAGDTRLALMTPSLAAAHVGMPEDAKLAERMTEQIGDVARETPIVYRFVLQDGSEIDGRVVDAESSEPIAGALVWAPGSYTAATSDRDGRFALRLSPYQREMAGLFPRAVSPGHAEGTAGDLEPGVGARRADEQLIRLRPAATLDGRVVDSGGRPIEGARVSLAPLSKRWGVKLPYQDQRTHTDARGRFAFVAAPAASKLLVTVEGPPVARGDAGRRYAAVTREAEPLERAGRRSLEIVLADGLTAVGHVLDADGNPIEGAEVILSPMVEQRDLSRAMAALREQPVTSARSDAEGRFAIDGVSPGTAVLSAAADGFAPAVIPGVEISAEHALPAEPASADDATEPASAVVDVGELRLAPEARIEGVVVDADERRLEGIRIVASSNDGPSLNLVRRPPTEPTVTDPDGRFSIGGFRSGQNVVVFAAGEGYLGDSPTETEAPDDDLLIVLQRASTISGRVVDPDGEPVAGAQLQARLRKANGTSSQGGMAGTDGTFSLDVRPGRIEVEATAPGLAPALRVVDVAAGQAIDDLELRLERGATVVGVVLDPEGLPLARATVGEASAPAGVSLFGGSFGGSTRHGHSRAQVAVTGPDGRFELEGTSLGPTVILASHDRYGERRETVQVESAGEVYEVELQFDGGVTISGTVTGDGLPVEGARVQLLGMTLGRGQETIETTDADGRFAHRAVEPGTYVVQVTAEGWAAFNVPRLEVGGDDPPPLDVELKRGVDVIGVVRGLDLDELARTEVRALAGGFQSASVDYEGEYRLVNVAPGPEVRIQAQVGSQTRSHTVEISPAETEVRVDFEFGDGFDVAGVVRRDGVGVASLSVHLVQTGGSNAVQWDWTNPDGRFAMRDIRAGRYRLMVMDDSMGRLHQETIDLSSDVDLEIDLRVVVVEGTVTDAETGQPLAGAQVAIESGGRSPFPQLSTTDPEGRYRLEVASDRASGSAAGDGRSALTARREGYAPSRRRLPTPLQGAEIVDFQMRRAAALELAVSGAATPQLHVAVLDGSGQAIDAQVLPLVSGRSRLTLADEATRLLVGGEGIATIPVDLPPPPARDAPLGIVLQPPAILQIRAPALDDLPRGSTAAVDIVGPNGPFREIYIGGRIVPTLTLRGGTGSFEVPSGAWRVIATTPDGRRLEGSAEVGVGGTAPVLLQEVSD